jgi:hypothetical protein
LTMAIPLALTSKIKTTRLGGAFSTYRCYALN